MRRIALLLGILLALALAACGTRIDRSRSARIERYLVEATHFDPDQRIAFSKGLPFLGMTPEEARISMFEESSSVEGDRRPYLRTYRAPSGQRYDLEFDGTPPVVTAWFPNPREDLELEDIDDLRPDLPFSLEFGP